MAIIQEEPVLTPNDLALDGRDIMRLLHIPPGPEVGRWKERLYQYVLEDPSRNTPDALQRYLMEHQGESERNGINNEGESENAREQ